MFMGAARPHTPSTKAAGLRPCPPFWGCSPPTPPALCKRLGENFQIVKVHTDFDGGFFRIMGNCLLSVAARKQCRNRGGGWIFGALNKCGKRPLFFGNVSVLYSAHAVSVAIFLTAHERGRYFCHERQKPIHFEMHDMHFVRYRTKSARRVRLSAFRHQSESHSLSAVSFFCARIKPSENRHHRRNLCGSNHRHECR